MQVERKKCEWTEDEPGETIVEGVIHDCEADATHTTCDPRGGVVCEKHRCRCSRPIGEKPEQVVLPNWIARMLEECEHAIEHGLDHSLHNAPGRVRLAHHALDRLTKAIRRLALAEEDKDALHEKAKLCETQRAENEALRRKLDIVRDTSWKNAREGLLHALRHIADSECPEEHDDNEFCPRRAAKEAIDGRPCSACEKPSHDA